MHLLCGRIGLVQRRADAKAIGACHSAGRHVLRRDATQGKQQRIGGVLGGLKAKGMQVNEITSAEQVRMFERVKPVCDKNVPTTGAENMTTVLDALKKARGG